MTSRLTREAFIPSWPIAIPSDTAMVTNSREVPPLLPTPSFTRSASRSRWTLQGVASFQQLATATNGFRMSSSDSPIARRYDRLGARAGPPFIASLLSFLVVTISVAHSRITKLVPTPKGRDLWSRGTTLFLQGAPAAANLGALLRCNGRTRANLLYGSARWLRSRLESGIPRLYRGRRVGGRSLPRSHR